MVRREGWELKEVAFSLAEALLIIILIYIQAFQLEIVDFHTGLSECGDFGQNWSRS